MAYLLTAKAIENAKGKDDRYELPDGGGLYLVVQPSGARSWAYRYRHYGKPRKLTLGPYPLIPLADKKDEKGRILVKGARTLAGQAREAVEGGKDPAADKKAETEDGPDRDLVPVAMRAFVERYAKPKNRDWTGTANLLGLRFDEEKKELIAFPGGPALKWATRRVQEITKHDVLDLLDADVDRGAPLAANRRLAHLRRFFNWLIERDVIAASPCAGVKAPTPENVRDRVLTDDEIRWFWKACEREAFPFGHLGQLLLLTGQRRSEVSDMVQSEIEDSLWTIPSERTKNAEVHTVHLTEMALSVIDKRTIVANESGYLFCTNGLTPISGFSKAKREIDEAMLKVMQEEIGEDAKLEPWRFHDLRRTVASGMARIGIDLPVIEKVLNHKSGSFAGIVSVYQRHGYDREKREALEAWARELKRIVTGESSKVVKLRA
jgi:integrase